MNTLEELEKVFNRAEAMILSQKSRAESAEAKVTELERQLADLERTAQCAEEMRDLAEAEQRASTERVAELEIALHAYADGAGDVKEWCGSGCSTKWFHGVVGSDYAKEVLGKVSRQETATAEQVRGVAHEEREDPGVSSNPRAGCDSQTPSSTTAQVTAPEKLNGGAPASYGERSGSTPVSGTDTTAQDCDCNNCPTCAEQRMAKYGPKSQSTQERQPKSVFRADNHIIGKVYDLTQENFNELLWEYERLTAATTSNIYETKTEEKE